METGTLTPRSADVVKDMLFTGSFGQPDGFGSVLLCHLRKSGDVCLSLSVKNDLLTNTWSVELTSEQRKALAQFLLSYEPTLWAPLNKP